MSLRARSCSIGRACKSPSTWNAAAQLLVAYLQLQLLLTIVNEVFAMHVLLATDRNVLLDVMLATHLCTENIHPLYVLIALETK